MSVRRISSHTLVPVPGAPGAPGEADARASMTPIPRPPRASVRALGPAVTRASLVPVRASSLPPSLDPARAAVPTVVTTSLHETCAMDADERVTIPTPIVPPPEARRSDEPFHHSMPFALTTRARRRTARRARDRLQGALVGIAFGLLVGTLVGLAVARAHTDHSHADVTSAH